ncbi:MAG TPA: hypothetical protein VE956_03405 [Nodularia sp. (in: cyanobacteria)]|nr:hypothetical protein [Nodularia sp. (in: cyanobacteria)]
MLEIILFKQPLNRKGTAPVLEQLIADITGWRSRVVDLFKGVAETKYEFKSGVVGYSSIFGINN